MTTIPDVTFRNRPDSPLEFEIFSLQNLFIRQRKIKLSIDKPHRIKFHQIIYITQGRGTHFIDFKPYYYEDNSIIFVARGQVQSFEINNQTNGFMILFTDSFLLASSSDLSNRLYNYPLYSPIIPKRSGFKNIIDNLANEYQHNADFAHNDILRLELKLLLLKAQRAQQSLNTPSHTPEYLLLFIKFCDLLQNSQRRDAQEFAKQLNISYKHLNQICKTVTGSTAKKYIDNHLVLEIKRNLATSNISIKELTYSLGFDEPTNLTKFFKKHTQQSPSQFRKIYLT